MSFLKKLENTIRALPKFKARINQSYSIYQSNHVYLNDPNKSFTDNKFIVTIEADQDINIKVHKDEEIFTGRGDIIHNRGELIEDECVIEKICKYILDYERNTILSFLNDHIRESTQFRFAKELNIEFIFNPMLLSNFSTL